MPPAAPESPRVKAQPEPPKPWTMPIPVHNWVSWRHADGSGEAVPAYVTKTYNGMINVTITPDGSVQGRPMQGVKHASDPSLKTMSIPNPGGVWDFCEAEKKQMDQEKRLARLEAQNGNN